MLFKFIRIPIVISMLGLWSMASQARADSADTAMAAIKPEAIRADIRFLADDLLEGRGTGSRGHLLAAHYVASQLEGMGLAPGASNGSYYQAVPVRSSFVDQSASSAVLSRGGRDETLKFGDDYLLGADPGRATVEVSAPIVFVGYGITAPSQGYDDYKGVDVKGKIVATIYGAPNFPTAVKAHYSASWLKRENAVAHGAIGSLLIYDPSLEGMYPFKKQVRDLQIARINWLDPKGQPNAYYPQLKVIGVLSMASAERLLAGSGHSAEQLYAAAKGGKLPTFPLAGTGKFHTVTKWTDIESPNVVAKIEGSDAKLKSQYIVYSAHLDHLGISAPVNGDSIYNGALDNASGTAVLMEVARAVSGMAVKPKRSMLFVAVTGEEAGLIGSDYFANYPTVEKAGIVANVNMDEDVMLWPLKDVVAYGAEHSSLAQVVERATQKLHLLTSPDPEPEQVAFIRSDQYSFVRQGIPAFSLSAGFKSDDPKIDPRKIFDNWDQTIYHQPSDDMQQPGLDFEAGALYARVALLCGLYIAEDANPPVWNSGDFFGAAFPRHPKQ
jgi:Peptidase family M28